MKKFFLLLCLFVFASCSGDPNYRPVPINKPISREIQNVGVALVLGGGGSKSYAHLGVIEVLEENNIPIDLIVGTSAGSAIGALYADTKDIKIVKDKVLKLKKWDLLDISPVNIIASSVSLYGGVSGYKMQKFFYENMQNHLFENLKIPFVAVAADVEDNREFVFDSGLVPPAVVASSSIPPFFSTVYIYGKKLADGGLIQPVPVEVARKYNPKIIISVDISSPPEVGKPFNMFGLSYKAAWMTYYKLCRMQSKEADIDIHPNTYGMGIFDDENGEEIYQRGREAAIKALPLIKAKMKNSLIPKTHGIKH